MKNTIREALNANARAINAAELVWLDLACRAPFVCRKDVVEELRRRVRAAGLDDPYPSPTALQIKAGRERAINRGALERGSRRYWLKSKLYRENENDERSGTTNQTDSAVAGL